MKKSYLKKMFLVFLALGIIMLLGSCILSVPTTITVFNTPGSGLSIVRFYCNSHSNTTSFGADLNAPYLSIPPGGSRTFTVLSGYNDARVHASDTLDYDNYNFYTSTDGSTYITFDGSFLY
jgi:hypothetical protein